MVNVKLPNATVAQASSLKFDETLFTVLTTIEYVPYNNNNGYGALATMPMHEVKVQASYKLEQTMQWVSSYGPALQQLSFADITALKSLASATQNVNNQIDMTNPLVLKAFETFLVLARMHSQVNVGG